MLLGDASEEALRNLGRSMCQNGRGHIGRQHADAGVSAPHSASVSPKTWRVNSVLDMSGISFSDRESSLVTVLCRATRLAFRTRRLSLPCAGDVSRGPVCGAGLIKPIQHGR